MPTKPMKVYAQFPTFNQQNEDVKSLINFFMENASLYFHGEYDQNDKLTSYSGVIRSNTRVMTMDYNTPSPIGSYELDIPYYPYFEGDQTGFPTLPTSSISESGLPFLNDSVPIKNGVLCKDGTINLGTSYKTGMNLYIVSSVNSTLVDSIVVTNPFTLPVIVTPKVNGEANTDTKLKPKTLATTHPSIPLQKIKIEAIFDENGDPISDGFVYDIQLRTSTFTMEYWAVDEESHDSVKYDDDVFYKIGLCVINPSDDIDTIVSTLKNEKFRVTGSSSGASGSPYQFTYILQRSTASSPYIFPDNKAILMQSMIGSSYYLGVPDTIIVPLSNGNTVNAIMYMKLCNQSDGSAYNDGSTNHTSVIMGTRAATMNYKSTEQDSPHWSTYIGLNITDQNLDSGFIPSYDDNL